MSEFKPEKLLPREMMIRVMGILLVLSPAGNFLLAAALSGTHGWWRFATLWALVHAISASFIFLSALTIAAGVMMLQGRRNSWAATLAILGLLILVNAVGFPSAARSSVVQATLPIVIDSALFILIYLQEFHQRMEKKLYDARMNRPFDLELENGPKVVFDGMGSWARIARVSDKELRIRAESETAPRNIELRRMEISLGHDVTLRLRFTARLGNEYVFSYDGLTPSGLTGLRRWALARRDGKRASAA